MNKALKFIVDNYYDCARPSPSDEYIKEIEDRINAAKCEDDLLFYVRIFGDKVENKAFAQGVKFAINLIFDMNEM